MAYGFADAAWLPFANASLDFVVAVMSLMDMPAHERVLAEVYRVLRPGGFLQFSISLSSWLNLLLETGFILERFDEPSADAELARQHPEVADTRIIAYILIVRCRKSGGAMP